MSKLRKYVRQLKVEFAPTSLEVEEQKELVRGAGLNHPVHGYFIYVCEKCGALYRVYLDKGLEDHLQDRYYPDEHKPVPFAIKCKNCEEGFCNHILWGIGDKYYYKGYYTELPEGASYFKNDPNKECGIPVLTSPERRIYSDRG